MQVTGVDDTGPGVFFPRCSKLQFISYNTSRSRTLLKESRIIGVTRFVVDSGASFLVLFTSNFGASAATSAPAPPAPCPLNTTHAVISAWRTRHTNTMRCYRSFLTTSQYIFTMSNRFLKFSDKGNKKYVKKT